MNIKIRGKANFPANVTASGGLSVQKSNGSWDIAPDWTALSEDTTLVSASQKEIWERDSVTGTYYRVSLQTIIDNLPTGPAGSTGPAGPGYGATSTTSNTIASSGSMTFETQSGLAYTAGARVRASDSANPATNYMEGVVTSYSGTTLVFTADRSAGSGTIASWNLNLAGDKGADGAGTGDVSAAATFGTDNVIVRSDGTSKGVQASGVSIDDSNNVSGVAKLTTTGAIELGNASDTTLSRSAAGIIAVEGVNLTPNLPISSKSASYTVVIGDANTAIYHPSTDNNARTFTIDSNANVAYPVGTCLTFINEINTVTIAITSDTLTLAGSGSTGSRTLAANGLATAVKVASTKWVISGTGLS